MTPFAWIAIGDTCSACISWSVLLDRFWPVVADTLHFVRTEHKACKLHDIVSLSVPLQGLWTFATVLLQMGIEWPWVPDTSLFPCHPQTATVWPLSTRCIPSDTCNNSVNGTKIELTLKADFSPLEGWKPWMSPVPSGSSESLFCSLRRV